MTAIFYTYSYKNRTDDLSPTLFIIESIMRTL